MILVVLDIVLDFLLYAGMVLLLLYQMNLALYAAFLLFSLVAPMVTCNHCGKSKLAN